jgi:RecJ-like exonuclease
MKVYLVYFTRRDYGTEGGTETVNVCIMPIETDIVKFVEKIQKDDDAEDHYLTKRFSYSEFEIGKVPSYIG